MRRQAAAAVLFKHQRLQASTTSSINDFDVGVIFANETSYLCIPYDRLGLAPSARVVAVETSCACVKGSMVSYLTPARAEAQAIRLDFVPELNDAKVNFVPMELAVQVVIEVAGIEPKTTFSVGLLHSAIVDDAKSQISE